MSNTTARTAMTANSSRLARHPGLPQLTCIAVVVPLAKYRQLRHALEEQQVNEEFDAGQADFLARRNSGRSAMSATRKRPAAWPGGSVGYQVNWEIRALTRQLAFSTTM
jgi:hypothetical protein